jgi:anti-sigma28 factor (negative regulator of flagellin synthesis)
MNVSDNESAPMHCPLDRGEVVPPLTSEEEHPTRYSDAPDRFDPSPEGKQASDRNLACTFEAREAKIRELQDAIKNGTYRVPAEQLADKMLRDTLRDQLP